MDLAQQLVGLKWVSYETSTGRDLFLSELFDLGTYVAESFEDIMHRVERGTARPKEVTHLTQPKKFKRLWELRFSYDKSTYRVFFAVVSGEPKTIIALHAVKKKSSKGRRTQDRIPELALKRLNDWETRKKLN